MEKFRWAYVGSGGIARKTAKDMTRGDNVVTAVWSRNPETAKSFAKDFGAEAFDTYEALLENGAFDAVYIATPHTSHAEYAIRAMQAGKPVLCEKPFGISVSETDALIAASRENHVYCCEAMWTWFSDVALTVKKWIDDGRIGEIKGMECEFSFPGILKDKNSRVLTPETAGGALLDVGIYPITYALNLFGEPKAVKCEGTLKNGIDVSETVVLSYAGFDCTLKSSLMKLREGCKIVGTRGEIHLPFFHMASIARMKTEEGKETFKGSTDYLTEFSKVAEEIRAGKTESEVIPFAMTRLAMTVMDECRRQLALVYPCERE